MKAERLWVRTHCRVNWPTCVLPVLFVHRSREELQDFYEFSFGAFESWHACIRVSIFATILLEVKLPPRVKANYKHCVPSKGVRYKAGEENRKLEAGRARLLFDHWTESGTGTS